MFEFWCLLDATLKSLLFIVRQDQKEMEMICMKKKWSESKRVSWKGGGVSFMSNDVISK
jgi:hypothetical protein